MTQPAYTDADVELVAKTFITEAKKNPVSTATPPWMGVQTRMLLGPTEHDIARAVLDALAATGRLATNGRCGDIAPSLSLIASRIRQVCRLTAGHAGWHRGDDGSEWFEHTEEPA